jgi:hypothetical protein
VCVPPTFMARSTLCFRLHSCYAVLRFYFYAFDLQHTWKCRYCVKKYIILLFFIFCRKKLSNWFKIFISDLLTLKPTPQLYYPIQCSHNVQIPQWSWFTIFRNYLWFVLFDTLLLAYCVMHETKGNKWYTVNEGISMLKFLIDNILSNSKGITVGIPTGTKCAPLLPVQSLHALRTLLKNVCTTN